MLKKIINVKPEKNYHLKVEFEDGISGSVDLSEFINSGIFKVLKDENLFNKVFITERGAIAWNEELEISSDAIYLELSGKSFEEILKTELQNASH